MGDFDDNGLGLEAFVRGESSSEGAKAPSQESEKTTVDESAKTTTGADTKTATTEPEKKEGKEPSPSDTETQIRSTVEEALKGKGKDSKETKEPAKTEEQKTAAGDAAGDPAKEEQTQKSNWDSDENPFKKQATEQAERTAALEQQLINTRNWATAVNQRNKLQERQLKRLEAKIDGTYDPEEDRRQEAEEQRLAETGGVSPEEASAMAELKGATAASLQMAYEQVGKEKTDAEIKEFDRLFQRNPVIMQRVTTSRRPIQEAMKVLGEFRIAQEYGTSDMVELIAKVKERAIAEATPALVEKITKEIMAKLSLKDKETTGIRSVRGTVSGRESATDQVNGDKGEPTPLNVLFPN